MVSSRLRVEQADVSAIVGAPGTVLRVHQLDAVAIGTQAAPYLHAQQMDVSAIGSDEGKRTVLRVQEADVLVIAAEGEIPDLPLTVLSFNYNLDGNFFYGIHVQGQGTFVYEMITGQWSKWASGSLELWNAQFHQKWNDTFYAASLTDNTVVQIDPSSILDDSFRVNTFRVTGRIESQSRRWVKNPDAQIFGSIGLRGGDIELSYSDDEGDTYSTPKVATMVDGVRDANVMFRNLGSVKSPGRIYKIEDEGALRRIQSLKVRLGDGDGEN